MERLPASLETAGLVRDALKSLNSDDSFTDPVVLDTCSDIHCTTWKDRVENALTRLALHSAISPDIIEFVRLLVICRGADKAVRMVDEVATAKAAIVIVSAQIATLLPLLTYRENMLSANIDTLRDELNDMSPDSDQHSQVAATIAMLIRKRIHYHRHYNLLTGALPHLIELDAWLGKIADLTVSSQQRVMFLASDSTADRHTLPAALQVPRVEVDTMALFAAYRCVEMQYRPQMFHAIRTRGWPASLQHALASSTQKEDKVADNKHCHVCERTYSCLWVHRSVCCECEDRIRQIEKRCPFRAVCKPAWFCPHSLRCLICDAHSCDECRLVRGDASTVTAVAGRMAPRRIAFDFDRTLASTKSGAAPVIGKHVADVDLISLMWKYPCIIVTRNQNKEAIRLFLEEQGAPPGLEICIVGKKESKVKFILGLTSPTDKERVGEGEGRDELGLVAPLATKPLLTAMTMSIGGQPQAEKENEREGEEDGVILFVDDSVAELADPLVAQEASIFRVLFVRSLA
jgi:hypothetical protein